MVGERGDGLVGGGWSECFGRLPATAGVGGGGTSRGRRVVRSQREA